MDGVDLIPERQAKPPEIRPNRACLRVAAAEWLPPEKLGSQQSLQMRWCGSDQMVDALGVEISAKALKLG